MTEENETEPESKPEEVIDTIREELKDKGLTLKDLEELEDRLKRQIHAITVDKETTDKEKAELVAHIKRLEERLEEMITAQEERDKKRSDSTTILVPPAELDPPTHQNSTPEPEDIKPENASPSEQNKKKRLAWW